MPITCETLLNNENFCGKFHILAGQNNLNNIIMWFYIATDTSPSTMMPGGGELLFINQSFTRTPMISQINYIDYCVKNHVPGMVIVGTVENDDRTGLMINYADEVGFPVLCIDNPMEVVGMTKSLAYLIIQEENEAERNRSFMKEIISDDKVPLSVILRRGFLCDINLHNPFFFISIGCGHRIEPENEVLDSIIRFRDNMGYIVSEIEMICRCDNAKILKYSSEWQSLCLIGIQSSEQFNGLRANIDKFLEDYRKNSQVKVSAGYSDVCTNPEDIKTFYRQSERALEFVSKSELENISVEFKELGIMRFISCLSEKEKCELIECARNELKPLMESDKNNQTDYMRTYRIYLCSSGSLQQMADSLYIHRNTLLKRLNQIEKLLGKDIHDPAVRHEGINLFFVLDYFGISRKETI
ncbi:MAG: helix-turn-helix domain-containing protein [Candidatus Ornithomonoglobus sp.]